MGFIKKKKSMIQGLYEHFNTLKTLDCNRLEWRFPFEAVW